MQIFYKIFFCNQFIISIEIKWYNFALDVELCTWLCEYHLKQWLEFSVAERPNKLKFKYKLHYKLDTIEI